MKPTATPPAEPGPLLAFGAHPDDIEFGCGAIVAREVRAGRPAHLVVCSRGESGSNGTPAQRAAEARKAARILGAGVEFVLLDGDGALAPSPAHALRLAAVIRRMRPAVILAPTLTGNQHPDHPALGRIVRDAARLARYGGLRKLRAKTAHAIGSLLYYAITPEAEPAGIPPLIIDVTGPGIIATWTAAMQAHASQLGTRNYAELQLARARVLGLRSGTGHAQALYSEDPLIFESLEPLARAARRY